VELLLLQNKVYADSAVSHEEKEQQRLMIRKVQGACVWKLNNLREVMLPAAKALDRRSE
jgi:hypothetical protein